MKDIEKQVVDVLTQDSEAIDFETPQSEEFSPLNQAVVEKDDTSTSEKDWNVWKGGNPNTSPSLEKQLEAQKKSLGAAIEGENEAIQKDDAPEQDIGSDTTEGTNFETGDASGSSDTAANDNDNTFELPTATAKQAADTILGMTNNFLGIGGGYFVKIRKHKEFYEFDEIVELIDQQNSKNIERIKLDKEDKVLLKPLIVAILKKKAKKLTPEQQLTGAIISILMKKAQLVMEVRAENDMLIDRILDIVREEKGYSEQDLEDDKDTLDTYYEEINGKPDPIEKPSGKSTESTLEHEETYDETPTVMDSIVEIAEEES
ncbi:hypothetical protein [Aquimarina latercula]|uniref:hypothetical protein n=1 Tax=Aquimarina latercula TaxID=987 RepID=UPI00042157E6|nr:hypothetical protein [Aquimarina latercula]